MDGPNFGRAIRTGYHGETGDSNYTARRPKRASLFGYGGIGQLCGSVTDSWYWPRLSEAVESQRALPDVQVPWAAPMGFSDGGPCIDRAGSTRHTWPVFGGGGKDDGAAGC